MPIRVALTETRNAYQKMPRSIAALGELTGRLEELREANLEHHVQLIKAAAAQGAQGIGLGELFAGPYFALERNELWRGLAEDAREGPSVTRLRSLAAELKMVIVAPIYERDAASGKRFNSAVFIESDGTLLGLYRKTHIPEGSNEQGSFFETFYYEKSDGELGDWPKNISSNPHFPVYESSIGRIAAAICYDRHFGGVAATLAAQGAEIIFSPAVTFGATSRSMWEMEFIVDACRCGVFIGGSNRMGTEPPWSQEYFGASYWSGPQGRLVNLSDQPELVIAELGLAELKSPSSSGWNFPRDLRPEIYDRRS